MRKHNIARDCIFIGVVRVDHVHTDKNLTDLSTKGLVRKKFHNTFNKM